MPIERKLAAIMFTDIAGYTESMSKSESKTLNLLEKKRSILNPLIKEYKGTFVKEIGDGTLSYFESAVNAATCAVKLQEATYDDKEMNIRVGIHIGDIVFKDGDVFGGGVNVASRLESIAPAGGVCVSKSVYDELSNQDDFDGIELGLQSLKGVGRLVEVFGLKGDKLNEPDPKDYAQSCCPCCDSKNEVPSIAIIPFRNKGKKKDEFFAYGVCSELISDVSSAGLIRVASQKQIEDAGEPPIDELAKKLNVRYIANGELWRIDDMFQLAIELYDSKEKRVIWSDNWQEEWDNLINIKSNLSDGLLKALNIKQELEKSVETSHTEAYELYLQGLYKYSNKTNKQDIYDAIDLIKKAIKLDNNILIGKNLLAIIHRNIDNINKALNIFNQNLEQSRKLGNREYEAAAIKGIGTIYRSKKEYEKALEYYTTSLEIYISLNDKSKIAHVYHLIGHIYEEKNDYINTAKFWKYGQSIAEEIGDKSAIISSLFHIGFQHLHFGNYLDALKSFKEALNRNEKVSYSALINIGILFYHLGEYDKALNNLSRSINYYKNFAQNDKLHWLHDEITRIYYVKHDYNKATKHSNEAKRFIEPSDSCLITNTYLSLLSKQLGKKYDKDLIHRGIAEEETIDFDLNFRLYELLENISYLETAYNQVKEKAENLEPDIAAKFLSYPIPKAIVEEWEKVK